MTDPLLDAAASPPGASSLAPCDRHGSRPSPKRVPARAGTRLTLAWSPLARSPRPLSLGALLLGVLLSSCAATPAQTPSFKAKPISKAPVLKIDWRAQLHPTQLWGYLPQEYATPVFIERTDDLVLGSGRGEVTRMRAGNGDVVWRTPLISDAGESMPIHAELAVTQDTVYAATLHGSVHALKLSDGKPLWVYRAEDAIEGAVVHSQGRLFVTDSRDVLYALDAATGKLLWRFQRPTPEFFTIKGGGQPVVDQDVVFNGFADGTLVALQIDDGQVLWRVNLGGDLQEFTDVDLPVILTRDTIYASSYAGGLYAINPVDGSVKWRMTLESLSSMRLVGAILYVSSAQGRVMAVDVEDRQVLWSFRFKEDTPANLTHWGPYLFVSTSSGPLAILDRQTGAPLSKWSPGHGFNARVVFDGHRAFALSNGGYVYGMRVAY